MTCIYLNEGWLPAHGGALPLAVGEAAVDFAPQLETRAVFLSDQLEHEVTPSFAERWALTTWFSGPSP